MKFEIRELDDGSWLLHAERRWGDDTDNEQIDRSFPTFKKMLSTMNRMMQREYRQRARNK